jgi:hypothetical protein
MAFSSWRKSNQRHAAMPLVRECDATLRLAGFYDEQVVQNGDPEYGHKNTDRYR